MTELDRLDLPQMAPDGGAAPLDTLEARVARAGSRVLGRLCELQWEELDAQAVAQYRARHKAGSVVADGYETLLVASRFGTLALRRQVCATATAGRTSCPATTSCRTIRGCSSRAACRRWPAC